MQEKIKIKIDTTKLGKVAIIVGVSLGIIFTLLILANAFFQNNYLEFRSPLQSPILVKERQPIIKEVIKEVEVIKEKTVEVKQEVKIAKVSAYSCGGIINEADRQMNCPNGITTSGTKPKAYHTMACDKANLGKKFEINGTVWTCEDTGGAIKGAGRFDIYLPTIQEAREFGVQHLAYREI